MKLNLKKRLIVLTILTLNYSNLQAQKNTWHLFQPNANYKNVQFNGNPLTPNLGSPFSQLRDKNGNPFTSYLATNVMTDEEGKLLFTVISTLNGVFLFDINNQLVGGEALTNAQGSKEIAIVPIDKGVRYHIIAASTIWEYDLANFRVSVSKPLNGSVVLKQGNNGTFSDFNVAVKLNFENNNPDNCLISYNCYYLLANINGDTRRYLCELEYVLQNEVNRGKFINEKQNDITTDTYGFNSYLAEMDISPDGNNIAFADDRSVFVVELDNFFMRKLNYDNGIAYRRVGGIEFTNDNQKLVFSAFDISSSNGSSYDKVYLWDFSNTNPNTYSIFSSSANYARSAIETGKDGKMYVANSNGLYQLNISSISISSVIISTSIYKNMDLFGIYNPNLSSSSFYSIYNLPDQIDGKKQEFLKLSEVAYSIRSGKISWLKTVFMPSNGINWSNTSHGLTSKGSGRVIVLGKLEFLTLFYVTKTVVLKEMDIRFNDDAECNVYQNVTLNLVGTTLKGMHCGLMWQGVDLRKSSRGSATTKATIKMDRSPSLKDCWITDAYNGIKTLGSYGTINISSFAKFEANEYDINVHGIKQDNLTMNGVIMYGSTPLRNQTHGYNNYEDYDDYLKRTVTHILVKKSNVIIGGLPGVDNINLMFDAQHGVYAIASSVQLYNADISKTKMYGCWFNANMEENKHELTVKDCKFHELRQGMRIENRVKRTTIQKNEFTSTDAYAIEYKDNPGGKLLIGDETDVLLGNKFNACNWAAIQCWGNARYIDENYPFNSKLEIRNNIIDNHVYASGIAVSEPVPSKRSYELMKFNQNKIGLNQRVGQGIVLRQITGANNFKPLRNQKGGHNADFMIEGNNVKFSTALNPFYNGIFSENSEKLNFIENEIHSGTFGDWRNVGIKCSEGKDMLVHKNTIQGGKGLLVTGNGMYSNYYCNKFNECVNGIQLGFNLLRMKAGTSNLYDDTIHAHIDEFIPGKIWGRPNVFNGSGINPIPWGTDIDVFTNTIPHNRWDFTGGVAPVISISIAPPLKAINTIVHAVTTSDPCPAALIPPPPIGSDQIYFDYNTINDPILQWKLKYAINRYNQEGKTTQWVNEPGLIAIQSIEDKIYNYDYAGAKLVLDNFNPTNLFEVAFKTVYNIWVNNRLELDTVWIDDTEFETDTFWIDSVNYITESGYKDTRTFYLKQKSLTENEAQVLSEIAGLDATLENPAAYPARAILWGERHLQYSDAPIPFYPNITGYVKAPCEGGGNAGIIVKLFDSYGVFTGIETLTKEDGFFLIEGAKLNTLNSEMNYYISVQLPNLIIHSQEANYTQLALQSYHILDCTQGLGKRTHKSSEITIYPNPSSGLFNFTNMPLQWKMELHSIQGATLLTMEGAGNTNLNALELPKGIYIATIIDTKTNEKTTKKLLVQ